ncbi:MAG: hypothetical protein WBA74_16360, partial [Cyclobacteriaceae bacterium]
LYLDETNFKIAEKNVKAILTTVKAKPSLKPISKVIESYEDKINDPYEDDAKKKKYKSIIGGLKNDIPKEYKYQLNAKGYVDYIKCVDLLQQESDVKEIKSGDKVLIKLVLTVTVNPKNNNKHISAFILTICKVQKEAVKLYKAADDSEFFDALSKYKKPPSESEADADSLSEENVWD